jgi:hypothetical protein
MGEKEMYMLYLAIRDFTEFTPSYLVYDCIIQPVITYQNLLSNAKDTIYIATKFTIVEVTVFY